MLTTAIPDNILYSYKPYVHRTYAVRSAITTTAGLLVNLINTSLAW